MRRGRDGHRGQLVELETEEGEGTAKERNELQMVVIAANSLPEVKWTHGPPSLQTRNDRKVHTADEKTYTADTRH